MSVVVHIIASDSQALQTDKNDTRLPNRRIVASEASVKYVMLW